MSDFTPLTDTVNGLLPKFTVAFQPIINLRTRSVAAYEALTRGVDGSTFPQLIEGMDKVTRRRFQREITREAIRSATALGIHTTGASLCLNLEPDTHSDALDAEFIRGAAEEFGLPCRKIVLEFTENHKLTLDELKELLARNERSGFATAMDDFGAGYAGLTMLVDCRPQILKFDRVLISTVDTCTTRQAIVKAFVTVCESLEMVIVAEGIETEAECQMLEKLGIVYMQGYLFSRPVVGQLPEPRWELIQDTRKGAARLRRSVPWFKSPSFTLPAAAA